MVRDETRSHPDVVVRPPVLHLVALLIAVAIKRWRPHPIYLPELTSIVGLVFTAMAVILVGACLHAFNRRHTPVSTHRTPSALIEEGPYRYSRNPIYIALALLNLGFTFWTNNGWGLVLLLPVLIVIQKGVVEREEAYLTARFGEAYTAYTRRVRRWV